VRGARPGGWDDLTPRGWDVVRLAADGMLNAEIARELGLATRSIDAVWDRVFLTVGLSRRELVVAAYIREIERADRPYRPPPVRPLVAECPRCGMMLKPEAIRGRVRPVA
jgi:DNA-binding CsgD family transcriptional regulator